MYFAFAKAVIRERKTEKKGQAEDAWPSRRRDVGYNLNSFYQRKMK